MLLSKAIMFEFVPETLYNAKCLCALYTLAVNTDT